MIAKSGASFYRLNLIRDLRERELKAEQRHRMTIILGLGCFGFFVISLLYSGVTMLQMESVLASEKEKVERLQTEYKKYTAAKLIVDKADIELLNSLQHKGVFWTGKLASMAKHLPDNYWITSFKFDKELMFVRGFGYVNSRQEQLVVLDNYLNRLRADTTFAGTFPKVQLNLTERREEGGRVAFEFSAFSKDWKLK